MGHSCIVNLDLGDCQCTIWAHHGGGSSVASGGALNQLERMASGIFANIYLAGHQHTKPVVPIPFMNYSGGADTTVNRYLVSTGSFLKGYVVGSRDAAGHPSGTYVEKAMMRPVTLGAPLIKIRPRFRNGYPCPDITVSI